MKITMLIQDLFQIKIFFRKNLSIDRIQDIIFKLNYYSVKIYLLVGFKILFRRPFWILQGWVHELEPANLAGPDDC